MAESRFSVGEFAKSLSSNAEKVVFNEVQKNFFRKESPYFGGTVDVNFPCGGAKLPSKRLLEAAALAEEAPASPTFCDLCPSDQLRPAYGCDQLGAAYGCDQPGPACQPSSPASSSLQLAADSTRCGAKRTEKLVQIKGVGFDLLYTRDGSSAREPTVREINLEVPCKIIMAVVLIAYAVNWNLATEGEVESLFGSILEACRSAMGASAPLWMANRWLWRSKELVVAERQSADTGTVGLWWRKVAGVVSGQLAGGVQSSKAAPQPVSWTDKVTSLFGRV